MKTMSAAMVDPKSLMGANEVFEGTDLPPGPRRIPSEDSPDPLRHRSRNVDALVRRLVEQAQSADQHVTEGHRHLFMDRDLHLDPGVRPRRDEPFRGGRRAEVALHLFGRVPTLEMERRLLVEAEIHELSQWTDGRAERTIPGNTRAGTTEPASEESADLFGHGSVGRQLPPGDRDQAIAILEDCVISRDIRFGFLPASAQQGS